MKKIRTNVLAILQNAWNPSMAGKKQPQVFRINRLNHSGKKLYKVVGNRKLLVTNVNPIITKDAKGKGKTDINFLIKTLLNVECEYLLVCGSQAQEAVEHKLVKKLLKKRKVIVMPHPASRTLTNDLLHGVEVALKNGEGDMVFTQGKNKTYSVGKF